MSENREGRDCPHGYTLCSVCRQIDPRIVKAGAQAIVEVALDLIQADPHQWSARPCPTCRAVSALVGRPFGCEAKKT